MNLFKEVADIKTADQLHLPTPEVAYHTIATKPTQIQQDMVKALSERASKVHSGAVSPDVDNMLKITSDGRKLGLDQRIINPMLPDEETTKVNQCVANILQYWRDGEEEKLTQLVFCDISTPKATPSQRAAKASPGTLDSPEIHALESAISLEESAETPFTVYEDVRQKLIDAGMPPEQMQTLAAHPLPAEGFVGMEIRGDRLTDKENAGAALLDTCKEVKGKDPVQIGSYRGFTMSVAFDSMWKTYTLTLKGQMTHRVELGSDARGNLVRIENALDKMPERLRSVQEQLENLYNQQAAAKAEVGKPFPQEQELAAKTARLIELDMELNLDGKGQPQPEQAIAKSARPSVLDRLKASPVHGAPEKPHKKEMEAR